MAMNPKLRAALKARRKPEPAETPREAMTDPNEAAEMEGPHYHHEQVRRHLEKGLAGTRRAAKIHLKMAKFHHDKAMGTN
jgi:hypothetical protein